MQNYGTVKMYTNKDDVVFRCVSSMKGVTSNDRVVHQLYYLN